MGNMETRNEWEVEYNEDAEIFLAELNYDFNKDTKQEIEMKDLLIKNYINKLKERKYTK